MLLALWQAGGHLSSLRKRLDRHVRQPVPVLASHAPAPSRLVLAGLAKAASAPQRLVGMLLWPCAGRRAAPFPVMARCAAPPVGFPTLQRPTTGSWHAGVGWCAERCAARWQPAGALSHAAVPIYARGLAPPSPLLLGAATSPTLGASRGRRRRIVQQKL